MASSHFHQTTPSQTSDTSELLCSETSDTIHHGPGPHSFLPPHQCQEDLFPQALDFLTLVSQFQFDIPPTTPFPLSSADQFTSWSLQDITTPTGGFSPQEVVHQEEPSVHDIFSSIWDEGCLISGQTKALHDRVHQHTSNFEYSSLESYLAEDMSSSASNKMITRRLDTPPIGSKRARTPSDLSDADEPQSKRIRWDPNTSEDAPAPAPVTESGAVSHPHTSTSAGPSSPSPTEEVESIREFKRGNRCGHNGCGKWHTDTSIVSRHRRAHVDRYPCPNPNCEVTTTTYRALQRHWSNPRGLCSAYKRVRKECLVRGDSNVEAFNPKIHRPYKSLKLKHGKHVNKTAT